jgi:hypothetical protein
MEHPWDDLRQFYTEHLRDDLRQLYMEHPWDDFCNMIHI